MYLKRITDGGLGAEPPAARGFGGLGPYAEISLVTRSRSSLTTSLTTRTTLYSEIALEVVLQVSL